MFSGYSAWFAPELAGYRLSWKKNGGEERQLAEADIAFVSDRTSSNTVKPAMKILRPDWIEDSIRGEKRLSLTRYKRTFPALERWDSAEYSDMLATGMEAFESTNVISLTPQLHQPEISIQDLSVTNSTGEVEPKGSTDSRLGQETQFQEGSISSHETRQTEKATDSILNEGEHEEYFDMPSDTSDELDSLQNDQLDGIQQQISTGSLQVDRITPLSVILSSSSQYASPQPNILATSSSRKRQLPETIRRTKRREQAAVYFKRTLLEMDKAARDLYVGNHKQLRIIDIDSADITLRQKGRGPCD
ncbi:hypothetical protein EDD11_006686 [Mortierella claussenii]|nr:hypothetical protein EDD11_006686 [Mortierella claussenii]